MQLLRDGESMRILVVDDMREFKSDPPGEVVYRRDSRAGLATIKSDKKWDRVYLDHDLGYFLGGGMDTIAPVLNHITDHADDFDPFTEFYVITSNPYAGDMMERSLRVCGLTTYRLNPYRDFHYVW